MDINELKEKLKKLTRYSYIDDWKEENNNGRYILYEDLIKLIEEV